MTFFGRYAPNLASPLYGGRKELEVNPFQLGILPSLAELDFANRSGIGRMAHTTLALADSLENPASQLQKVVQEYKNVNKDLTTLYQGYVKELRQLSLPEEEVAMRADAWIKPTLAIKMEMLKLKYPFAVGGAAGGALNPIESLANGTGNVNHAKANKQFNNWRSLKKAFKAKKHHRRHKSRKS